MKNDIIEHLDSKQWHTCILDMGHNTLYIYRGVGLNYERDGIDSEDLNDDYRYFEMEGDEIKDLIQPSQVSPLINVVLMDI